MTTKNANEDPLYFSDEEDEDSDDEDKSSKKKRRDSRKWIFERKFSGVTAAEETVNAENTWAILTTHTTVKGKKRFYRCNKVPRKGVQCAAKIFLLFEEDTDAVLLFRTGCEHDHDSIKKNYDYGICHITKAEINKLSDLHLKPKSIMEYLKKKGPGLKMPTKQQLSNYLADRRRHIQCEAFTVHLGELKKWIISHKNVPSDENKAFVIDYYIRETNPFSFCVVLSSKNLLKRCISAEILHADSTHKLMWQGFPVLIVGTTDKNRKFHPICLTLCTNECESDFITLFQGLKSSILSVFLLTYEPKVLICDAAKIQNAFTEVFGVQTTVKMCWAHAKKNISTKLDQTTEKDLRKHILEDINALQSATSPEVFSAASVLFLKKWEDQKAFITYFEKEWLKEKPNWYLGAGPVSPATNNELHSFIRDIKDQNTLRERLPLSRFLEVIEEMVNSCSQQATEDNFATQPIIQLSDWKTGYKWAKTDAKTRVVKSGPTSSTYLVLGDGFLENIKTDEKFQSFDDYQKKFFSFWYITLLNEPTEWINGCCNCPDFYHKYICKHVLGLAILMNYVTPPLEIVAQPIGLAKKRGRPPKRRPALIIQ